MHLNRIDFGDDFIWGVSTAAHQIEGAFHTGGKGLSIWDVFSAIPGKIYRNQNANISCDFYHKYAHDISLMRMMNIRNFRFSIAWSRIMPEGTGTINQKGIDFYNTVIDFCLEVGIEPWVTLYHWDLPYHLEKTGGWTNREIVNQFCEFVQVCIKCFGDRVKHWMILNEPVVFTGAGYFLGLHAPGKKGLKNFLPAVHHAALCQAEGARMVKSEDSESKIGTTFSCSYIEPNSASVADSMAAIKIDAILNRLFVEPLAGLGYPTKDLKLLERLEPYIKDGDEAKLAYPMDFIGIQNYTREIATHSNITPLIQAKIITADKREVETTVMKWEVYPEAIYQMLQKFSQYKFPEILVTENGAAFDDFVVNDLVNDHKRIQYLQDNIAQVLRAKNEGINVRGYFVWTFTDNFEWAEGYKPRFGLVYIDFKTKKRIIKKSGKWYSEFLKNTASSILAEKTA